MCAVVVAVAAPVAAQTTTPTREDQQIRFRLQDFETILVNAVRHGANAFAQKVADQIPANVQLMSDDPQAKGFAPPTPDGGLMFVVIVPPIRRVWLMTALLPEPPRSFAGPRGTRPVGVGAASNAEPDPMERSPVLNAKPEPMNADAEYSRAVVDAVIDSVVDNAGALPLNETEWLTVAVVDGVGPTPGVVNNQFDLTTYLSIKGSDLLQLRQGKITRDEARKLVHFKQR